MAQEVCDRVGILFKGRLIALGEVQTLLNDQSSSDLEEVFLKLTRRTRERSIIRADMVQLQQSPA